MSRTVGIREKGFEKSVYYLQLVEFNPAHHCHHKTHDEIVPEESERDQGVVSGRRVVGGRG